MAGKDRRVMSPEVLEMVADRFRLLAEPLRLRILHGLQAGEMSVTAITAAVESTQPNVSKHLKMLQDGGLVGRRQQGNTVFYPIADPLVFELCDLVCARLQAQIETQARTIARGAYGRRNK